MIRTIKRCKHTHVYMTETFYRTPSTVNMPVVIEGKNRPPRKGRGRLLTRPVRSFSA